ncbi:hypothetical protein Y032_0625g792 [Ancylostoma ceylanicum]|uniref:von Willebrand factor type A domain protein n=1 Tax=Ancylostoma ceylanicum TaxID=53326 RepID=A0A016WLL9_9BILA|nr:hypothetical protein Y032_0625g792 [Ancylostoma ceylanicum]
MHYFWILVFLLAPSATSDEITPCVSDVVIVVDGTTGMGTTDKVNEEIRLIESLVSRWSVSKEGVRVAILADSIANDYDCPDYFENREELLDHLQQLRRKSIAFGLYPGTFKELARFLDFFYVSGHNPSRVDVPKVILIFTTYNNKNDVNQAKERMLDFFKKDFHVSIIGIDVKESVYSGIEHHKFFALRSSDMKNINKDFLAKVEKQAIAPWCHKYASTPPTTPRPTTRKTSLVTEAKTLISTTTTPYMKQTTATPPVDVMPKDFLNCSCTEQNLWLDIVFIIDVSASMGHEGLVEIFANMITLVSDFTFDRNENRHVRIGIVAVANKVLFSEYNIVKYSEFEEALDKIEPTNDKRINLLSAFIESQRIIGHIDRKNVPDVIVVYSSSFEEGGVNDPTAVASQLKISGTQIITVAFVGTGQSKVVLNLGKIASPRMNFTTFQQRDLVGKILDGFCQANCFCRPHWHHLIVNDRRYGECFFLTEIDANWRASRHACRRLRGTNAHLVYVNNEDKQQIIEEYGKGKYASFQWLPPVTYHIGLSYNQSLKTYLWEGGAINAFYSNWDDSYPDLSKGECVRSEAGKDGTLRWRNEECASVKASTKAMCQAVTCDTDHYCD